MSGHSKWSSIKHKKAITDSKRGRAFTKLIKEITIAARLGGGDLNSNPRLRTAVTLAKKQSMPNDNIDRAIKKGTGEIAGASLEEITYEGYGPGGVAIMVDVLSEIAIAPSRSCASSSPGAAATWARRDASVGCSKSAA